MTVSYYSKARAETAAKLAQIIETLGDAHGLADGKACVYATGSFGRLEAGPQSDLDVFIVSDESKGGKLLLSNIDAIKLKYLMIVLTEKLGIPPFDGDGKFLNVLALNDFIKHLGGQEDDYRNTLTGRLLLLLESKPIVGRDVYDKLLDRILKRYFRDFDDNADGFIPAFLLNDIIRMWRTFCVNYEFWRRRGDVKSKIKNLKLKYHRLLTCYSAVIYLLHVYGKNRTVKSDDVRLMVDITPTERLEVVQSAGESTQALKASLQEALELYSAFLEIMHQPRELVEEQYENNRAKWRESSHEFGKQMSLALVEQGVGTKDELHRIVLI